MTDDAARVVNAVGGLQPARCRRCLTGGNSSWGPHQILDHVAFDARCVVPGRLTGRLACRGARRLGCLGRRSWCHGARCLGCSDPGSMGDGGRHLGCLARWREFFATWAVLDFHAVTWPIFSVRGGRLGCLGGRPRRLTVGSPRSPRRTGRIWRAAAPATRQDDHGKPDRKGHGDQASHASSTATVIPSCAPYLLQISLLKGTGLTSRARDRPPRPLTSYRSQARGYARSHRDDRALPALPWKRFGAPRNPEGWRVEYRVSGEEQGQFRGNRSQPQSHASRGPWGNLGSWST